MIYDLGAIINSNITYGIMGLKPWAFFLILFIIAFGAMFVLTITWDSHKRSQNIKKTTMPDGVTRKILGVFVTANKEAYEVLCNVVLGEVKPDSKMKKVKPSGTIDAPSAEGQRIPKYFILPQYCFKTAWPKGAKKAQQVEVMESFYAENIPLPRLSYEDISMEERERVTATLADLSSDQNFANAVITEMQQKFADFTKAVKEIKNLRMILYIAAAGALIGLGNLIFTYQGYNILHIIRKFLGVP